MELVGQVVTGFPLSWVFLGVNELLTEHLGIRGMCRVSGLNIMPLPELKLVIVLLVSVVVRRIVVWSVLCHFLNGADCPR